MTHEELALMSDTDLMDIYVQSLVTFVQTDDPDWEVIADTFGAEIARRAGRLN